jgi:catechol 2,3-dioxygenase-like lactoylglutathione lyase family enzyme
MKGAEEFRIALTVDDYDASLSFYRDVLGLPIKQQWPSQEGHGVLLSLPETTLELIDAAYAAWVDDMEVGRRVSGRIRFALQFSNLQAVIGAAVRAGVYLVHETVETPWHVGSIPTLVISVPWSNGTTPARHAGSDGSTPSGINRKQWSVGVAAARVLGKDEARVQFPDGPLLNYGR